MRGVFFVPRPYSNRRSPPPVLFPNRRKKTRRVFGKTPLVSTENREVFIHCPLLFSPRSQPALSSPTFRPARFPFILSASPFFCQNAAICAKTPLFYHILSEKDEAKQDILQTFFIFASETYVTIVALPAAHFSSLCNRDIPTDEPGSSVESPPHHRPATASSMASCACP